MKNEGVAEGQWELEDSSAAFVFLFLSRNPKFCRRSDYSEEKEKEMASKNQRFFRSSRARGGPP